MALELDVRRIGDVMVVKCRGKITAGSESQVLERRLTELLDSDRHFVLHLGEVSFVDSSGLGLLVRLAGVTRARHGDIKLCSVGSVVDHTLTITNLKAILETHPEEAEAISAFYNPARRDGAATPTGKKVLCVDKSEDVLALLREVLRHAGYSPVTTSNLNDARLLAKATQPSLLLLGPNLSADQAHTLRESGRTMPQVALDRGFETLDAHQASQLVLTTVREKLGS